jgi:hypothetical protein
MALPEFNQLGDLPVGVHSATLDEVITRFGRGTPQRQLVTGKLRRIHQLAQSTGKVLRFVIFGSYITAKPAPNDVDIILVMHDDFCEDDYAPDVLPVFNHMRAHAELGASVFWTRPSTVLLESVDDFIAYWQTKRDLTQRGIVEITLPQTDFEEDEVRS